MKPQSLHKLLLTLLITAGVFLPGIGAQAQALGPIAGPDIDTAIAGRPNLALASGGATTFASSELNGSYGPTLVNDGIIANAWIAATSGNGEYVAVAFPGAVTLGAIVFKSDYAWRSWGTWSLQYTTNGSPGTGTTNWTQIGTYSWASGDPLPRLYFEFASISNVTAIRLVISDVYAGQNCVQELEAYGVTLLPAAMPPGMSPLVVGAGVDTAIGGRTNWALASGGGIAFASSQIAAPFGPEKANNGIIDSIVEPFIPATPATTEYLAIAFPTNITLAAVVWMGQYGNRNFGSYRLEYTTNAAPNIGTPSWTAIGEYYFPYANTVMPRSYFELAAPIANVTGMRLVFPYTLQSEMAIQEFEAYSPAPLPEITTPPVGGTVGVGDNFTFTVGGTLATSYQWQKNGTNIPGATASSLALVNVQTNDAGDYEVVLANASGSVTSAPPAVLTVTNAPVYASYQAAILADNPIHYYPLGDASGTTAADLGSLNFGGGTYMGGCTLGQPGPATNGGTSVYFNGAAGTYVNLELFHPGDEMTVECWVNLDQDIGASVSYATIVGRWDASYELFFHYPANSPYFAAFNAAANFTQVPAASSMSRGNWHHLVGIYQANGSQTIYKDGVATTSARVAGVLKSLAGNAVPDRVLIGAAGDGTNGALNFKGYITDVAFYDHAVAPGHLLAHYNYNAAAVDTNPPALTSVASANGLTIQVVFDETVRNASATNTANYTVNPGAIPVASAVLQADFKTVVLTLAGPSAVSFTVAAGNVLDVAGNASSAASVVNGTVPPPGITMMPVGGTVGVGDNFTFTVAGTNAATYQWQKNGTNIPSATDTSLTFINVQTSDSGDYSVVLANAAGSVTSAPLAVLTVTNVLYASYQAAVLVDNPIHYYPLNEASGTTAADLGSLNFGGGTYTGGTTLGQPGPATNGGTSVYFDGASGTYVDLGLFHPGDEVTVECWANLDADARDSFSSMVGRFDASYELDFWTGFNPHFIGFNAAGNFFNPAAPLTSRGNWHHLVGIYTTNGVATVYNDGVATTAAIPAGVLRSVGGSIIPDRVLIGATRDGTNSSFNFKGYIADVAFYDHALVPGHILAHYNYNATDRDTIPPAVASAASVSGTTVQVVFDEAVRNASATNLANYTVNGGASTVATAMLQPDFKTVVLFLASPISGAFTVAAENVLDVAGNASSAANVVAGSVTLTSDVVLADNFTTPDSASLNNDLLTRQSGLAATQSWVSVQSNGADFAIFNNSLSITNTGDTSTGNNSFGVVYPNLDLRPYERFGSFHLHVKISPVVASGDSWGAVKVRLSDPTQWILNSDGLGIFIRPGGSWGVIDGASVVFTGTVPPAATYAVDIEVVTNVITAQINGLTIVSGYTLSATQTMNYVSLMSNAGASAGGATGVAATFDDFEFSALGSYVGLPEPALTNPTYTAGTASFQFSSVADVVYVLEYKDDLTAPVWTSLGNLVGTGGPLNVSDSTAAAQRFYRLRVP